MRGSGHKGKMKGGRKSEYTNEYQFTSPTSQISATEKNCCVHQCLIKTLWDGPMALALGQFTSSCCFLFSSQCLIPTSHHGTLGEVLEIPYYGARFFSCNWKLRQYLPFLWALASINTCVKWRIWSQCFLTLFLAPTVCSSWALDKSQRPDSGPNPGLLFPSSLQALPLIFCSYMLGYKAEHLHKALEFEDPLYISSF